MLFRPFPILLIFRCIEVAVGLGRYNVEQAGVTAYWWCLVEGDKCGLPGPQGRWDKCIGQPAGYLEPVPTETVKGCQCQLPFLYRPESFGLKECDEACKRKTMIYTGCTDIDQRGGAGLPAPAWCATVGPCGTARPAGSLTADGWTHWDVCKPAAASPAAVAVADVVRTQNGCRYRAHARTRARVTTCRPHHHRWGRRQCRSLRCSRCSAARASQREQLGAVTPAWLRSEAMTASAVKRFTSTISPCRVRRSSGGISEVQKRQRVSVRTNAPNQAFLGAGCSVAAVWVYYCRLVWAVPTRLTRAS